MNQPSVSGSPRRSAFRAELTRAGYCRAILAFPVARLLLVSVVGSMVPVSCWIAIRRWNGAGESPSNGSLVFIGWGLALIGAFLHASLRKEAGRRGVLPEKWLHAAWTVGALLAAFSATFPAAPTAGVVLLWSLVVTTEVAWWARQGVLPGDSPQRRPATLSPQAPTTVSATIQPPAIPSVASDIEERISVEDTLAGESADESESDECETVLDAAVNQQWTRGCDATGQEWIETLIRVPFAAGQRHAAAHLVFSPHLASRPRITAHVVEGAPAELIVAEARPFGARIELRRPDSAAVFEDASVIHARVETPPLGRLP